MTTDERRASATIIQVNFLDGHFIRVGSKARDEETQEETEAVCILHDYIFGEAYIVVKWANGSFLEIPQRNTGSVGWRAAP